MIDVKTCFEFAPLAVWAVLLYTFVRPLHLGRKWSVALAALLLVCSQKFLIYRFFGGGDSFLPNLPERFINLTGWTYSASMILFGLTSLWFFLRFIPRLRRWPHERWLLVALAVVALMTSGWGVWEGVRVPDVKRIEVTITGLPAEFDGYRIVQLTDLHVSTAARAGRTRGIVTRVNALKPDLVCITGDFVDGKVADRLPDLSPLAELKTADGVLGCMGNHEAYHGYIAWRRAFESLGIRMLDNSHKVIKRKGAKLVVGGVTDSSVDKNRDGYIPFPDVPQAFAEAPAGCRILLRHRPVVDPQMRKTQVGLQLSGHTHGGAILGMDLLVASLASNQGHVRGLYHVGDVQLFVSSGTGQWAGFPVRLGVPAQIAEIVLRSPCAVSNRQPN